MMQRLGAHSGEVWSIAQGCFLHGQSVVGSDCHFSSGGKWQVDKLSMYKDFTFEILLILSVSSSQNTHLDLAYIWSRSKIAVLIIIIIRKGRQCKAERESDIPYQSENSNPTIPTYRQKEEKGKNSRRL